MNDLIPIAVGLLFVALGVTVLVRYLRKGPRTWFADHVEDDLTALADTLTQPKPKPKFTAQEVEAMRAQVIADRMQIEQTEQRRPR